MNSMHLRAWRRLRTACALISMAALLGACGGANEPDAIPSDARSRPLAEAPIVYFKAPREVASGLDAGQALLISFAPAAFEALQVGDQFELALPGAGLQRIEVLARATHVADTVTLSARIVGAADSTVRISGSGHAVSGVIALGGTRWRLRSSARGASLQNEDAAGVTELAAHTPADYQRYTTQRRQSSPLRRMPESGTAQATTARTSARTSARESVREATAASVATIDIGLISDQSYQSALGGRAFELADIADLVALANQALSDSGAHVRYRVVGYWPQTVNWTARSMGGIKDDLDQLSGGLAPVWGQQLAGGADVLLALTPFNAAKGATCGLGDLGVFFSGTFSSSTARASAVVARGVRASDRTSCADTTLAHELGHILGSEHDLANAATTPAFDYSYGYGRAGVFGDIMSYINPRLPYFSNPDLFSCAGQACGIPLANAVRTFNNTAPLVAAAMDPLTRLSGIYWDPAASGSGWTIEARGSKALVGAFSYNDNGSATWSTGVATPCASASASWCVGLDEYQNGQTVTGAYRAPSLKRRVADAVLTFSPDFPASLTVQLAGVTRQLQRFVFDASSGLSQPPQWPGPTLAGTFWNPDAPGTGIFMERQGDTIAATYFYFRADGTPAWSTVSGRNWTASDNGSVQPAELALVTFTGGQTLLGSYRAPTVQNATEAHSYFGLGVDNGTAYLSLWNQAGTRSNEVWARFPF